MKLNEAVAVRLQGLLDEKKMEQIFVAKRRRNSEVDGRINSKCKTANCEIGHPISNYINDWDNIKRIF